MRVGRVAIDDAVGGVLAHSLRVGDRHIGKGRRLDAADRDALVSAGLASVMVAILDEDDVPEDVAAREVAERLVGPGLRLGNTGNGRADLHAVPAGLVLPDLQMIDALNRTDPAIALATLPPFARVDAGRIVATLKIIPFAVAGSSFRDACRIASRGVIKLAPFRSRSVHLIQTAIDGTKITMLDKTKAVLEERLGPLGCRLAAEDRCRHQAEPLAEIIARSERTELLVIFGAVATVAFEDIVPEAIALAGGEMIHLGMPSDPGNLLGIARRAEQTIIIAPGCARSRAPNGFDRILERLMADLPVGSADIMGMGVGGLLRR